MSVLFISSKLQHFKASQSTFAHLRLKISANERQTPNWFANPSRLRQIAETSLSRFLWSIWLCSAACHFHVSTARFYAVVPEVERINTNIEIKRAPLTGTPISDTSSVFRTFRKQPVNCGALTPEFWSKTPLNPTMFKSKLDFYCNASSTQRINLRFFLSTVGIKLRSTVPPNLLHQQFLNSFASA